MKKKAVPKRSPYAPHLRRKGHNIEASKKRLDDKIVCRVKINVNEESDDELQR